jgi:SpoVK/Ycf46/Vps4 family AAA+-type ATPase
MDDATLRSLRAALDATPDNIDLRVAVLRAHVERRERADALATLGDRTPEHLQHDDDRALVAQLLLDAEDAARGLDFLDATATTPERELLRARLLLATDDRHGAAQAYKRAVNANATLEDRDLLAQLSAREHKKQPGEEDEPAPFLRVLANDDTDDVEVQRLLAPQEEEVDFSNVGGLDDIKHQISKRIITPFQKPELYKRFKKRVGGGILMYGPPGCGKTLLARATAGEVNAKFYNVQISDILDLYIGESERKLSAIFEKARADTPSVLFFDELEALAAKRQYTREQSSAKLVSQFLAELDGFNQNNHGVLILGATNVPWAIDPAFRRPGRFDRVLFVPPPDKLARMAILDILLAERPCEDGTDVSVLAERTAGFSGADLKNLVETAADEAIDASLEAGREVPIQISHLTAALKEVKATTLEWLTTARNYARYANEGGQYDEVLDFLKMHGKQ